MNAHVDVAAYAIGALSDREMSQFEDHLVQCASCASELESMVSVVAMMADVSLADVTGEAPPVVGPYTAANGLPVIGTPPPARQTPPMRPSQPVGPPPMVPSPPPPVVGPPLTPPTGQVPPPMRGQGPALSGPGAASPHPAPGDGRRDERRDQRREKPQDPRLQGTRPAKAKGKRDDRRPGGTTAPPAAPKPISQARGNRPKRRTGRALGIAAAAAVVGAVAGGAGVVESGLFQEKQQVITEAVAPIAGPTVSETDKRTGAHIEAALTSRPWGTNIEFQVTKIEGPKTCRLIAVRENGETEVLSTWTVPDGGYGYEVRPQPLALEAATALESDDITQLRVQAMDPNGDPSNLVTVRV
jgi:hypothetical protein